MCIRDRLSLGASVFLLTSAPSATFYLLPTRAWELMIGSMLALWPIGDKPWRKSVREPASALALAAILLPCFAYSESTPFPGIAALPPCLGTALIIWAD